MIKMDEEREQRLKIEKEKNKGVLIASGKYKHENFDAENNIIARYSNK